MKALSQGLEMWMKINLHKVEFQKTAVKENMQKVSRAKNNPQKIINKGLESERLWIFQ